MQADASGSLEAVKAALNNLPQGSVVLRYLLALPNEITVSDVDLAAASQGLILGFNVEPSEAVQTAAKQQGTPCTAPLACIAGKQSSKASPPKPCAVHAHGHLVINGNRLNCSVLKNSSSGLCCTCFIMLFLTCAGNYASQA